MIELLQNLSWWQWIVFALVLGAIETFMPGAVAIWFCGLGRGHRPAARRLVVDAWQFQWVLWAVLGIVAMLWYRGYKKAHPDDDSAPTLNQRGVQYIGQSFTLVEPSSAASARSGSATASGRCPATTRPSARRCASPGRRRGAEGGP